jgi:membrane protein
MARAAGTKTSQPTYSAAMISAIMPITPKLFSWYVSSFGSYNETYGSLGTVIGFMTWIWISTVVVLPGCGDQR